MLYNGHEHFGCTDTQGQDTSENVQYDGKVSYLLLLSYIMLQYRCHICEIFSLENASDCFAIFCRDELLRLTSGPLTTHI